MVMLIISDIKYFLLVLLCVLIGFAQGFWLLLNDANPSSHFTDVKQSYYTTFMFMFGQIDSEELQNGKSSGFSKLYLVAFMLTTMLLLFNLLIALMGDSFSRTKEKIEAHYWKELASFMVDQSMPTPLLALLELLNVMKYEKDDFIHVVKYASDIRKNHRSLGVNENRDNDDDDSSDSDDEAVRLPYVHPSGVVQVRHSALEKAFHVSKRFIKAKATTDAHQSKLAKKAALDGDIIHRSAKSRNDKSTKDVDSEQAGASQPITNNSESSPSTKHDSRDGRNDAPICNVHSKNGENVPLESNPDSTVKPINNTEITRNLEEDKTTGTGKSAVNDNSPTSSNRVTVREQVGTHLQLDCSTFEIHGIPNK